MQLRLFFRSLILLTVLLSTVVPSFAQDQVYTVYAPLIVQSSPADDELTAAGHHGPQPPFPGERQVRVMTRNLYFGADLTPVITAQTLDAFITAVTQAYLTAQASDFAGRARAIAREIAATEPLFVGLQEAAIWRTGTLGSLDPATTVEADFVQLILGNLHNTYEIVAARTGFDAEAPTGVGVDVRLTIQDVLLVRRGPKPADLHLSNIQMGTYATMAGFQAPTGATINFPRQWIAVDAELRGKSFRLITTHLESIAAPYRVGQAQELLAGPANTTLPTILIGDMNAEPNATGDAAATFLAAGFVDGWSVARPGDPGFTCCQAADLRNRVSQLDQRIDLVLVRNGPNVVHAELVGNTPISRKPASVRWPSDHASVVATVKLP